MYTIRLFEATDADFRAINTVANAMYPEYAETLEQTIFDEESWDKNYFYQRELIEKDGKVVGVGTVNQVPWSFHPQKYSWSVLIHPDYDALDVTRFHFDHVTKNILADKDVIAVKSSAREDQAWRLAFFEEQGFVFTMRFPHSQVDVDTFDASKFADKVQRVKDSGIEIFSVAELQKREPEKWQSILHEMCSELDKDIPSPDSIEEETLDMFIKSTLERPSFMPEGWFVAVDGDTYVGITMLYKNLMNPKKLWTGLTGTLRSHRRQGIATVLKVNAIAFAKGYGANCIEADNEENNPMYQINMQLGFEPIPAWMDFEKAMDS